MPGMGGGLQANNPTMEAAFRSALHHQAIAVILVALLLAAAYAVTRTITAHRLVSAGDVGGGRPAAATGAAAGADDPVGVAEPPEPAARRILRITFGCLWIFDGLLQLQAQMPIGLATQVVSPTADAQPHWLATVIQWGVLVWQNHPVEAAVATVWIQVGIGAWMLVAPRGRWSRLGGLASVSWAIVVWVMGEGLGQILTPSGTWLFGAPGAVVFYAVAGALIALPESAWRGPAIGRRILRGMGVVFLGGLYYRRFRGAASGTGPRCPAWRVRCRCFTNPTCWGAWSTPSAALQEATAWRSISS